MAHVTLKQSYRSLSDRLNLFPQGAPPTELLFRILQVLFTEEEAALVALLPVRPFTGCRRSPQLETDGEPGAKGPRKPRFAGNAAGHGA